MLEDGLGWDEAQEAEWSRSLFCHKYLQWCGCLTWPIVWRDGTVVDMCFLYPKNIECYFLGFFSCQNLTKRSSSGRTLSCSQKMFIQMHLTVFHVSQCENTPRSFLVIVRSLATCARRRVWFVGHAELFPRNKILPNRFRHKVLAAQMAERAWLWHAQGVIPSRQRLPTWVQKRLGVSLGYLQLLLWNALQSV